MGFEDLPANWDDRPLTDPALVTDVLDLVVFVKDRLAGAVTFLLCDEEARLVQPVAIGDWPATLTYADRVHCVSVMVESMGGRGAMVVALAREDGLSITAEDLAWRRAAEEACRPGVRLLGVHVVTMHGSRVVPGPLDVRNEAS
jgi:hypothetical protein